MSFIYGHFKLEMTCQEFDQHMDRAVNELTAEHAGSLTGTPTYDFDRYREALPEGKALLSTDVPNVGVQVVGTSYRNIFDHVRMYVVAAKNGIILFLDGEPENVEKIGFHYDYQTKSVTDPATGKVILLNFDDQGEGSNLL